MQRIVKPTLFQTNLDSPAAKKLIPLLRVGNNIIVTFKVENFDLEQRFNYDNCRQCNLQTVDRNSVEKSGACFVRLRERCHKVTERVETLPALITPTLHNGYFYFNLVVLFQSQILV